MKKRIFLVLSLVLVLALGVVFLDINTNLKNQVTYLSKKVGVLQAQVSSATAPSKETKPAQVNADNFWQQMGVTPTSEYEEYALKEIAQYIFDNNLLEKYKDGKTFTVTRKSTNGKLVPSSLVSVMEGNTNDGIFDMARCSLRAKVTVTPSGYIHGVIKHKGWLFWDNIFEYNYQTPEGLPMD